ncbi:MAG: hypothetical protein IKV59_08785 [Lachnospiraceae bacterium]|nr:hypothetical protein [Lachnospiraceae bacterium]
MEDKKKKYPPKITLILRVVVAAYLLYLVWGLRSAPAAHEGAEKVIFIVAIIVFIAAAAFIGGFSLKALLNGEYDDPDAQEDAEE